MDNYQHGVFFEANDLSDIELNHIEKFFKIKRKCGGGECEILKVGVNTYKICFMAKEAQERVLAIKDHDIILPGQNRITISLSLDNVAESGKQPKASDQQAGASAKSIEKVITLESYLLRYLSECTDVNNNLKKRLSVIYSTFQIHTDSDELVVILDQEAQDSISLKKWNFFVEELEREIKQRYILHFVVERDRLAILQENPSLSKEDVKIYFEGKTLAVVVGECDEVEKVAKLIDVQDKQQDEKECHVSEKQFALVKEHFEQSRKSSFSNITITQDKPGIVALKGPEKEVHAGEKELLFLIEKIKEKRIPLHHSLLTFLESSGSVQRFQNRFQQSLRSPVVLEIAGSDVLLLSLSDGALEEAAVAVQRDLCFETFCLENTEEESPGFITLKEDLNEAVQQANHDRVNVGVSYPQSSNSSDTRINVEIVGYTNEVRRLKDILLNYKKNNENTQQTLPLPVPEMVEHFTEILTLIGVNNDIVEMNPTSLPSPCVHLMGPRCEVDGLKKKLETSLKRLVIKRHEVNGPGVQHFFQGEGREILESAKQTHKVEILPRDRTQSGQVPTSASASLHNVPASMLRQEPMQIDYSDNDIDIKVVLGGLEEQKADVLVAPMIKANLSSTMVGSCLLHKGGQEFQTNFNNAKGQKTLMPGDVLEVDGTPLLGCSKVFFIECLPNGGKKNGIALHSGLGKVLALCKQNFFGSVAFPIIGPGLALSVTVKDACNILTREITTFLYGSTGSLQTIYITILPNYANSAEMFLTVCGDLSANMVDNKGQALFHSLTTDLDEIVMAVSGTQVHLVFGDITNETTNVVVNTTDFEDFQTGVCKDILTKAGPQIQSQLTGAEVKHGEIFKTQPGGFPCKQIMHVCGQRDASVIKTLAKEIVLQCERDHYQSVAIPAICTGKGGMDPKEVGKSILQGVKDGIQGANPHNLKTVRIIMLKINVFLAFKATAQQIFGGTQLAVPAPLVPIRATTRGRNTTSRISRSRSSSSTQSLVDFTSLMSVPVTPCKAEFVVIGHTTNDVSNACKALQQGYEIQCSSHSFSSEDIACLRDDDMEDFNSKVKSLHLEMKKSGTGSCVVTGLKDGVNELAGLIHDAFRKQLRKRNEEALFAQVTWCIQGPRGTWQKLSKEMNYKLEKGDERDGIEDAQGVKWTVDLRRMEATACDTRQKTSLKRLQNISDFALPIYWDNMNLHELLKVVDLDQSSAEYQSVKADFKKTVSQTVLKIERIQNVHLRKLYEGRKIELENRNGPNGAQEKILYHGTTEEGCSSIQTSNFDRSFAGQNATVYGVGTYFAVNASYSANPVYSKPTSDGNQLMFVARVLTGQYTNGEKSMKKPPDGFDSLVDNTQNPTMFVVFHDCQAYPDYLITFK